MRNLLSFGPDSEPIEFGPLNVLIGPNGSGKSNIIEAIDLLRASASSFGVPIREGGGATEWLWKGPTKKDSQGRPLRVSSFSLSSTETFPTAEINATVNYPDNEVPLRHRLSFTAADQRFSLSGEAIENERDESSDGMLVRFFSRFQGGDDPVLTLTTEEDDGTEKSDNGKIRELRPTKFSSNRSVLSQYRDPSNFPEITYLGDSYKRIMLYREWDTGRNSKVRLPQPVDLPNDFLAEDASNLALVLNFLGRKGNIRDILDVYLSSYYDQYRDYTVSVEGATVQVLLREKNLNDWVSASRLSDGTLRFLCLASILCHPSPPPLICLEEPEIGMHPDILPTVAEMLIEASGRAQIIVTTHSDILVDALTHVSEAVLVCEKESNSTTVRRLDQDALRKWLKEYSLGDLWRSGQLGGNRW